MPEGVERRLEGYLLVFSFLSVLSLLLMIMRMEDGGGGGGTGSSES